jgi:DNA repair exonuclease SbcCD ATPase subunit
MPKKLMIIPGVGAITAQKLHDAGLREVDAVAEATLDVVMQLTGFYENRASAIHAAARDLATARAHAQKAPETGEPMVEQSASDADAGADSADSDPTTQRDQARRKLKRARRKVAKATKKLKKLKRKDAKKKKIKKAKKKVKKAKKKAEKAKKKLHRFS